MVSSTPLSPYASELRSTSHVEGMNSDTLAAQDGNACTRECGQHHHLCHVLGVTIRLGASRASCPPRANLSAAAAKYNRLRSRSGKKASPSGSSTRGTPCKASAFGRSRTRCSVTRKCRSWSKMRLNVATLAANLLLLLVCCAGATAAGRPLLDGQSDQSAGRQLTITVHPFRHVIVTGGGHDGHGLVLHLLLVLVASVLVRSCWHLHIRAAYWQAK